MKHDRPRLELRAVLDEPVSIVRSELGALIGLALGLHLFASMPGLLALPLLDAGQIVGADGSLDWSRLSIAYGTGAVGMLLSLPASMAMYIAVRERLAGREFSVGAVLAEAFRPGPLVALLVSSLLTLLGLALCVLPGVLAATMLALVPVVIVGEQLGLRDSFSRSIALARFKPANGLAVAWMVLLVLVVWLVVSWLVGMVGAVPVMVWTGVKTFQAAAEGSTIDPASIAAPWWLTAMVTLLTLAFRAVIDLYPIVALTRLYHAATDAMTGDRLEAMIAEQPDGPPR
jgi:hypothetical protein